MKTKIIGLFILFSLAFLYILNLRQQIKQALPRTGEVEIVGGVYTPYLLLDSALYFLKGWDESIDFAFARSLTDKARFELIFANKRLLEMERLARDGNFTFTPRLLNSFTRSLEKAVNYATEALKQGEDIEELTWLFQESVQDQQRIFRKILSESPENERSNIQKVQKQDVEETESLLKKIYMLN